MANLQETEFRKFKEEMTQVIEKLLNEKIFTEDADILGFGKNDFKELRKIDSIKKDDLSQADKEAQAREKERLLLKEATKPTKTQRKKITCLVGKYLLENESKVNSTFKNYKWNDFFNVQDKDKLLLKKADIPVINSSSIERTSDEHNLQSNYAKCVDMLVKTEKKGAELKYKPDYQTLKDLVYVTNYTVYTSQASQKYSSDKPVINPDDVQYVLDKYC